MQKRFTKTLASVTFSEARFLLFSEDLFFSSDIWEGLCNQCNNIRTRRKINKTPIMEQGYCAKTLKPQSTSKKKRKLPWKSHGKSKKKVTLKPLAVATELPSRNSITGGQEDTERWCLSSKAFDKVDQFCYLCKDKTPSRLYIASLSTHGLCFEHHDLYVEHSNLWHHGEDEKRAELELLYLREVRRVRGQEEAHKESRALYSD